MRLLTFATGAMWALSCPLAAMEPYHALNDTGINLYADDAHNNLQSEPTTHPGQDGSIGRDAAWAAGALAKAGGGGKGFDFTKIANNGTPLPSSAPLGTAAADWACTSDNTTGLVWEVKVRDSAHFRYAGHTYTWYNSSSTDNGGYAGTANGGRCSAPGRCDTESFVLDVNAARLCGHSDWRMPTFLELQSIVDYSYAPLDSHVTPAGPMIDPTYFPNTSDSDYWTGTASAQGPAYAWIVGFGSGIVGGSASAKSGMRVMRVVRNAQ